jgi:NDP-hexose 4,6-dehydratase
MFNTVAVTGADGFIGSHLVEALVERGNHVKAMAQYNAFGTYGWLDTLSSDTLHQVTVQPGDIRDRYCVRRLLDSATMVFHLAALIAIPHSYHASQSYIDTNIGGTLNVLEVARELGTTRVIHTSTSEAYGTAKTVPIAEDHPLQAQSPYAATKIAADKLVESYHLSFDLPTVTLRPFNTYGPRQSTRAVIPTIVTQIARGRKEIRLGALKSSRDFLFVRDTVAAFMAVADASQETVVGSVFNAGTNDETTIGELARTVAMMMDSDVVFLSCEDRKRPERSEVERLVCDASALRTQTGWRCDTDLNKGLAETIQWYCEPNNLCRFNPNRTV